MPDAGPGYRHILTKLFCDQDAPSAIRLTIERDASNAYSFFRYCRRKALDDDSHRHPQYLQRVRHFQHVYFSPQDPEWQLLNDLMEGSLRFQYRVETSRKPYLPRQDKELKAIRCMPDVFYEYQIPEEYMEEAIERERESRERKHLRPVHIGDLQTILSIARNWRELTHPWELVACASILCGRRTQEITHTLTFESYQGSNYLIAVDGILKQTKTSGIIPILCEYQDFAQLMAKIREHDLPIDSSTHRLKPAFHRVFGEWFSHTQRRNIYCEAAYRVREISGFHPHMPKLMWFDEALCHSSNVIHQATNLTYQTLVFNE